MTATPQNPSKLSFFKLNVEKQESLVKVGILTIASILCELLGFIDKIWFVVHEFGIRGLFVIFLCSWLLHIFFFLFAAFSTRLFSILRFESVIHEFDPYFNYRTTKYLTENGFYNFHNWFDEMAW